MINFGTSALMRLLLLNSRPQVSAISKRLQPSRSGYDFHKSLRTAVNCYWFHSLEQNEIQMQIASIRKAPERNSAREGFASFLSWCSDLDVESYVPEPFSFVSPQELFKFEFKPDIGVTDSQTKYAIHIWNTKSVDLNSRIAKVPLALIRNQYSDNEQPAVLCLRTRTLHLLTGAQAEIGIANAYVQRIENLILDRIEEQEGVRLTGT